MLRVVRTTAIYEYYVEVQLFVLDKKITKFILSQFIDIFDHSKIVTLQLFFSIRHSSKYDIQYFLY